MKRLAIAAALAAALSAELGPPVSCAPADDVSPATVARGQRIYAEGRGGDAEAEIMARIGGVDGVLVPAWTLPCVTCHGGDGRGGLHGQEVVPPDIRWPTLRQAAETASGRKRPAYADLAAVRRAVTEGLDAGGQVLQTVMPRYELSDQQWSALGAYLRALGRDAEAAGDAAATLP